MTIAHRGASGYAPENTLAAIRAAVDRGCDMVEVDVQRTRDGELVLIHDTDVKRTSDAELALPGGAPWAVAGLDYEDLAGLDAGSWFDRRFAGERVPTLSEAIDLLAGTATGLLLEVKQPRRYPGIAADVSRVLDAHTDYVDWASRHGLLVVQSFAFEVMAELRGLQPDLEIGLLGHPRGRHLRRLASWAQYVNPRHRRITPEYVRELHGAGLGCFTWTVNKQPDIDRVLTAGVDGVISNFPDLVLERDDLMRGAARLQTAS